MRPVFEPSNIYAHKHEEQDVILWYNRAIWHSIVSISAILKILNADRVPEDRVSRILRAQDHAPM